MHVKVSYPPLATVWQRKRRGHDDQPARAYRLEDGPHQRRRVGSRTPDGPFCWATPRTFGGFFTDPARAGVGHRKFAPGWMLLAAVGRGAHSGLGRMGERPAVLQTVPGVAR